MKKLLTNFHTFCTPAFLFISLVSLLVLGQLQRIQLTQTTAFYVHDLLLVVNVFYFATRNRHSFKLKDLKTTIKRFFPEISFVLWVGLGLAIAAITGSSMAEPFLYLSRLFLYSFGVYFLIKSKPVTGLVKKWSDRDSTIGLLISGGVLFLTLSFLQYLFLPDTRFLKVLGWDDHYYRLIGTQLDPGFTGIILTLIFCLLSTFKSIPHNLKKGLQVLLVLAIALTFSRATYLAWLMSLLVLIAYELKASKTRETFWYCFLGLWLGISIIIAPKPGGEGVQLSRTSTVASRTEYTQTWLNSMSSYQWVVGRGLFVAEPEDENATSSLPDHANLPDNLAVLVISSMGIGGIFLGALLLGKYLWRWRHEPTIIAMLVAVLLHSLFNNTLFQPFVWLWLWLGIATLLL